MIELAVAGISLGLYSGFSPGPLLVLVVSQTLEYGYKEGIKVALAPLITDLPIILVSVLFISLISKYNLILGVISILGGVYLGYMAYQSLKTKGLAENIENHNPQSLQIGATVNLLNPSPYLFWITIGSPMMITAYKENLLSMLLFLGVFYTCLVGSKIAIAYLTAKSCDFLTDKSYIYIMRILGMILILFALYFIQNGVNMLMIDLTL